MPHPVTDTEIPAEHKENRAFDCLAIITQSIQFTA